MKNRPKNHNSRFQSRIPTNLGLALILFAALLAGSAQAAPRYLYETVNPSGYAQGNRGGNFNIGQQFRVGSKDMIVTALGIEDAQRNGLARSHDVGIFTSNGQRIAFARIPAGGSARLVQAWRYSTLSSPVVLRAFQIYRIGGTVIGPDRFTDTHDAGGDGSVDFAISSDASPLPTGSPNRFEFGTSLRDPRRNGERTPLRWAAANLEYAFPVEIVRKDPEHTNVQTIEWDVTFGVNVTGFSQSNLTLNAGGTLTGTSITSITGSGRDYVVSVDTGSGDGPLGLDFSNSSGMNSSIATPAISGPEYQVDRTPPTLINLPSDMLVPLPVGDNSGQVNWAPPTASGDMVSQTGGPAPGSVFGPGVSSIAYLAQDLAGNSALGDFMITVVETRPTNAGPEAVDFIPGGSASDNSIVRGTGIDAPGAGKGVSFFSVNHAFLNNSGEILVEANLTGGPATENLGLWSNGGGGPLELVALESAASAGADFAGTNYKSFGHIALNNAGLVGSNLLVQGGGTSAATDRGTFSELTTGTLTGGMREGSTAPGAGTAVFSVLQDPAFAEDLIAHPGQLKIDAGAGVGGASDRGIWGSDGAADSLIIREGDTVTATGIGAGVTFGQIENRIVATGGGTIAFASLVQGNGAANRVVLAGQPGNLRLIAARNDMIGGAQISSFAAESLNDAGDLAFRAILTGTAATNGGIFTNIGGTNKLIAREGDAAPGQPAGVVFDRFGAMHLIGGGDLVFLAYLRGTLTSSANDGAIYRYDESADTLSPVVREGDLAISTDGAVVRLLGNFDVNANGGLIYTATLVPGIGDATTADNLGLWLSADAGGPPLLQARKGDEFIYGPGDKETGPDIRTITNLAIDRVNNPLGGVGSTPKVISDSGQAIIKVSNTLGGGAFLIGGSVPN